MPQTAARAGKTVYALKAESLGGHKDLNEYWVKERTLPAPLQRGLAPDPGRTTSRPNRSSRQGR